MTATLTPHAPVLGPPTPIPRRLTGAAVVLVVLLAVAGWSPRVLDRGDTAFGAAASDAIEAVAAGGAAQRISPVPGRPGAFEARDPGYRATFDATGFAYLPAGAAAPVGVSLAEIRAGTSTLTIAPGAWSAEARVLRRRVAPGVTERVTARRGEIEWDVVLDAPLPVGDLTVRADLTGATARSTPAGDTVRVPLAGGGSVDLGEVVVRDADGTELHRSLPVVEPGTVELRVPAPAVQGAHYPVVVDPTVSGPLEVAPASVDQIHPTIAQGGPGGIQLVAWQQYVAGQFDIYAAIVDPVTKTRTVAPFRVSGDVLGPGDDTDPDVAWNGSVFLLVWEHRYSATDHDILGRRFGPSGTGIGFELGIAPLPTNQHDPAVAPSGSDFLVTWTVPQSGGSDIYAGRIAADTGARRDGNGGFRVSHDFPLRTESDSSSDVSWDGESWLVVWSSHRTIPGSTSSVIESVRVATTGQPAADDTDIVSRSPGQADDPAVAWGGGTFLVVWRDLNNSNPTIAGRRVSSAGVPEPLGPFTVADPDSSRPVDPAVTYNGQFLVAWLKDLGSFTAVDLMATRVGTDGRSLDLLGFPVAAVEGQDPRRNPTVTPGPGGRWDVVYASGPGDPDSGGPNTILWRGVSK
jgi:hypothetical protein